jgi:hypothetical protein
MRRPEDDIRAAIWRFAKPPSEQVDTFIARGRRAHLAKGEPLCRLGDKEHRVAFLHTGIVRYHVISHDGEDVTKDFGFAPWFASSFGSAVRGVPARVAIAAVEDCAITVWPFDVVRSLYPEEIEWERFGRRVAELLYVRKEDRELAFLTQSAEQRYLSALTAFPPDLERVPQHMLATYLGIAPESLSRLKRNVRKA